MTITVIIPTFRAAEFIGETLQSVLSQTLLPDEIIVVDDCSPDKTVEVVERVARSSPVPVRVIRFEKNSGGPAEPINRGVGEAKGELIVLLDHDDRMLKDRIHEQYQAFRMMPDIGLSLGRVQAGSTEQSRSNVPELGWRVLSQLPRKEINSEIWRISSATALQSAIEQGCYAMTCSAFLFPRAVFLAVGGIDPAVRTNSDYSLLMKIAAKYDIGVLDKVVTNWELGINTLVSTAGRARCELDDWRVLSSAKDDAIAASLKKEWRKAAEAMLFEQGYEFRQTGLFTESLRCCLRSITWNCMSKRIAISFFKTVVVAISRKLVRRR